MYISILFCVLEIGKTSTNNAAVADTANHNRLYVILKIYLRSLGLFFFYYMYTYEVLISEKRLYLLYNWHSYNQVLYFQKRLIVIKDNKKK